MSTITTLNTNDTGSTSRTVINTNFTNLNTDKMETSVLDTDGTLAANSDAKVATQKAVKTYVDTNTVAIETTAGATHSLTTTAGQTVWVIAKGYCVQTGGTSTVNLKYGGVTKDSCNTGDNGGTNDSAPFCLMWTDTPGAATADITVTDGSNVASVKIMVLKF